MRRLILTAVLCSVIEAASGALAAEGGDAKTGHDLALRLCTPCHIVSQDQEFTPTFSGPPDFHSIANRPGTTAKSLRKFLATTHTTLSNPKNMPNPQLTDDQIRDIARFIVSLRDKH